MKRVKRLLKRVVKILLTIILVLIISGVGVVYLYGDRIQQQIIKNLNTQLNTPVGVEKIDVSFWSNFPFLTVSLNSVRVQESIEFSDKSLLEAKRVDLIFNPISLLKKDYSVNRITLADGELNLSSDRKGRKNYIIFKQEAVNSGSESYFSIDRLNLQNIRFSYLDEKLNQDFKIFAEDLESSINKPDSLYRIEWSGPMAIKELLLGSTSYLKDREVWSAGSLTYDPITPKVNIQSSLIRFREAEFSLSGFYYITDKGDIDLKLEGKETDIQNLISLLPENVYKSLSTYESQGPVYFDLTLSGFLNADILPAISVHFGTKGASIIYPQTQMEFSNVSFEGYYISNSLSDLKSAELAINNFSGILNKRTVEGSFNIRNFNDKFVEFNIDTRLSLKDLLKFYPTEKVNEASGELDIDMSFAGRLNDLKQKSTMARIRSNGEISFQDVSVNYKDLNTPFTGFNGNLLFNNENIAMNALGGSVGNSQFKLDGILGNFFSYLLLDEEKIIVDATLKSDFIDLDQLLSLSSLQQNNDNASSYSLKISPQIKVNFDCEVKKLVFRRFKGDNISGILKVRDQLAMFQNIRFDGSGGGVQLDGVVDASGRTIDVMTTFKLDNILLDSMFYVFEDFNQDFLVHSHLKGRVNAKVEANMRFTTELEFIPQSLIADVSAKIDDGELNNFEPMLLLAPYLPKDQLKHLRFSELTNDIHVEDQKIYIPQMQINSNVTNIKIGGTHTFDQHINYKIVAPLVHSPRVDKDELFGAVEDDGTDPPNIHLLLIGTTDDYEVLLDKESTKNQMVKNIKDEVRELKDAFKNKRKDKKKALELEEEEYFDWNQ